MKTSSIAIKLFSASALLFASSAVMAECVSFSSPITMDNTIPSLAGKQCSCLCTINPIPRLLIMSLGKQITTTTVASCNSTSTGNSSTPIKNSSSSGQMAQPLNTGANCIEQATSSPASSSAASSKKFCYKLNPAVTNTATNKQCGCVCSTQALSGEEIIQLKNPTTVTSCSSYASLGLACEKADLPPASTSTTPSKYNKAPGR